MLLSCAVAPAGGAPREQLEEEEAAAKAGKSWDSLRSISWDEVRCCEPTALHHRSLCSCRLYAEVAGICRAAPPLWHSTLCVSVQQSGPILPHVLPPVSHPHPFLPPDQAAHQPRVVLVLCGMGGSTTQPTSWRSTPEGPAPSCPMQVGTTEEVLPAASLQFVTCRGCSRACGWLEHCCDAQHPLHMLPMLQVRTQAMSSTPSTLPTHGA